MPETPACGGECKRSLGFEFTMAFQPVVDLPTRRIYAYEALVRGVDGEGAQAVLARVTPETLYAFDQACRTKAIELAVAQAMTARLNINFLPNAVYHAETCLRLTLDTARRLGFPMDRITFEFTENERVMDRDHLRAIVATYHRFGFQTALDDFGTGYAGLGLLADFQPDCLKIDRLLVEGIGEDRVRQAIVGGLVGICERLAIDVVAEGVETLGELRALVAMGITRFQGYLFARPKLGRLITEAEIVFPDLG
ncbi:EAL domain-containing protein [Rhodospirillum rubrum]|uniref:Diguanylate phosphodiesterase (EAL domain) n=1 Tax=Rhodospirillum rubrum (strain ATCC 11170 / ATH 1.1.1 / DSM 467 / LMG 4362 / NCIMB 8255 / S1) TaxID=269796 RepID=Q2RQ64_RHORT|nr:EAL domain-containing protein [Rhodospirillum rubrum]ABC23731.1 Putative diguanylate phosphodiesterase (EAL domain) [Rhodospirillum rubrum ATCC 11170]AEO49470.1 diguanylate phosphodiesterase [Rhodospirillum rubrum F11]MBK5955407.1 EAL domain-containing protein [Rhodospirillum rubrum]QXG79687.1 EAL domain-containing protein [Rhodospirillum rubrum]HAP99687.1 EAL domain-containing protein [Rhodospirillum rubrum]